MAEISLVLLFTIHSDAFQHPLLLDSHDQFFSKYHIFLNLSLVLWLTKFLISNVHYQIAAYLLSQLFFLKL
jgi:hypothetical protein